MNTGIDRWLVAASLLWLIEVGVAAASQGAPGGTSDTARAARLVEAWETNGDEGARQLGRELPGLRAPQRRTIMQALSRMKSAESQRVLLEVACGGLGSEAEFGGAVYYLAAITNQSDARHLFAARNPEVWGVGVRALTKANVPLDAELMRSVACVLQSSDTQVRSSAAYYLKTEPSSGFGREKAVALVASLESIEKTTNFNQRFGSNHEIVLMSTQGGWTCRSIIAALATAEGVDLAMLRELTPAKTGLARDCVFIAMGWRSDRAVKPELHRIMRGSSVADVRYAAVNAFDFPGYAAADDLPVLEEIAASDPLNGELDAAKKQHYSEGFPSETVAPDRIYPVRDYAHAVAARLSKGLGRETRN